MLPFVTKIRFRHICVQYKCSYLMPPSGIVIVCLVLENNICTDGDDMLLS